MYMHMIVVWYGSEGNAGTDEGFDLISVNGDPRGVWSDGATVCVADGVDDKVYAYYAYPLTKVLTATDVATTSATLNLTWRTAAWYYKSATTGQTTCTQVAVGIATVDLSGLTPGTAYTFTACTDNGCATRLATAGSFPTPDLSTSHIAVRTTRLTITAHNGIWWYKHTTPTGGFCSAAVAAGVSTADAVDLKGSTAYTFTAYTDSQCTTLLATASSFTTIAYGERYTSKEFNLISGHGDPADACSDGTTIWVIDSVGDKLYAYTPATGARYTTKEFNLASGNGSNTSVRGV